MDTVWHLQVKKKKKNKWKAKRQNNKESLLKLVSLYVSCFEMRGNKKKGEEIKSGLSHGFFMLSYNCHLCLALNSTSYFHINESIWGC